MRYIYHKAKNIRSGTGMQKMRSRGALEKWHYARKVLAGFPLETPFKSAAEVVEYLSGENIQCLLCGKFYFQLGAHLKRVHQVDGKTYKYRYNIMQKFGLCGAQARDKKRANILERAKAMSAKADWQHRRRPSHVYRCEAAFDQWRTNISNVKHPGPQFKEFDWHLQQVAKHYGFSQIAPPAGVASWRTYKKARKRDAVLNEAHFAARSARLAALPVDQCETKGENDD